MDNTASFTQTFISLTTSFPPTPPPGDVEALPTVQVVFISLMAVVICLILLFYGFQVRQRWKALYPRPLTQSSSMTSLMDARSQQLVMNSNGNHLGSNPRTGSSSRSGGIPLVPRSASRLQPSSNSHSQQSQHSSEGGYTIQIPTSQASSSVVSERSLGGANNTGTGTGTRDTVELKPLGVAPTHVLSQQGTERRPSAFVLSGQLSEKRPSFIVEQWNQLRRKSQALLARRRESVLTVASNRTQNTLVPNAKALSLPGFMLVHMDMDVHCERIVTEGGSGLIFDGQLIGAAILQRNDGRKKCTIKIVKENTPANADEIKNGFIQEVAIMWLFNQSRNFVKMLGYCLEPQMAVMKSYDLGTLKTAIHSPTQYSDEEWNDLLLVNFTYDIARAIAEMHHTGVVHNDIKPANILIERDETGLFCVLCDFGVAVVVDDSLRRVKAMPVSQVNGASIAYAAPEVFRRLHQIANVTPDVSESSDMSDHELKDLYKAADTYAFAIIMFEMMVRALPWGRSPEYEVLQEMVSRGLRPRCPPSIVERAKEDKALEQLVTIMHRCWAQDPLERPALKRVLPVIYKLRRKRDRKVEKKSKA